MAEASVTSITTAHGPPARLFYLDKLRVLLISLIVLMHLAITYGAPGSWYVQEVNFDTIGVGLKIVYTTYNATVQAFALGFFFLLSGYFTAASLERKGTRRFIRDRVMRLGIPFIVYTAIINPIIIYLLYARQERFFPFLVSHFTNVNFSAGPMWFVAALLLFTMVYLFWYAAKGPSAGNNGTESLPMPRISRLFMLAFTTGLIAFAIRLVLPVGWSMPILNFQLAYFTQYIVMFALGTMAWRLKWFERASEYRPGVWFGLAALMLLIQPFPFILGTGGGLDSILGGMSWQSMSYALWESFVCLSMVIGLSALFSRRFNGAGGWFGALPPNAYAVYVIHPAVMIALTSAFTGLALPPLVKFAVMAPVVLAACFVTAVLLRTIPGVKKIL
jgi:glucans biosynthesis protein C